MGWVALGVLWFGVSSVCVFSALWFLVRAIAASLPGRVKGYLEGLTIDVKEGRVRITSLDIGSLGLGWCKGRIQVTVPHVKVVFQLHRPTPIDSASSQPPGKSSVPSTISALLQIGSRSHPIWPLLLPLLRFTVLFHKVVNLLRLSVQALSVEMEIEKSPTTAVALNIHEARVELSLRRGIMTLHICLTADETGDLLSTKATERPWVGLLSSSGALTADLELPWPPQVMTENDCQAKNGFGYLRRPPILPSVVSIGLGDKLALRIDEDIVTGFLQALAPLLRPSCGSCGEEGPGPPSSELWREYLASFGGSERGTGVQLVLKATQWTRFILTGKRIDCCLIRHGAHPETIVSLESLQITTCDVIDDQLTFRAGLTLEGCTVKLATDAALPLHLSKCQASSTLVVTYIDPVSNSSSLIPSLQVTYQLENVVQVEAVQLSWCEEAILALTSVVCVGQSLAAALELPLEDKEKAHYGICLDDCPEMMPPRPPSGSAVTMWSLKASCPHLSASYSCPLQGDGDPHPDPDPIRYGATCLFQELVVHVEDSPQADNIGASATHSPSLLLSCERGSLGFSLSRREEETERRYSCPFIAHGRVEVVSGAQTKASLADITAVDLTIAWSPAAFLALSVLMKPVIVHMRKHKVQGSSELPFPVNPQDAPPSQGIPFLTSEVATTVLQGGLIKESPMQGRFRKIRVDFPCCLGFSIADMNPDDVLRWLGEQQTGEGGAWSTEVVLVEEACFATTPAAHKEEWCFTVQGCCVLHRCSDGTEEAPYCVVQRFATKQDGPVIDIISDGVSIEWTSIQQLRVMKVSMDVTLSVWVALLQCRRVYFEDEPNRNVNPPLDDPVAFRNLLRSFYSNVSARGNVLHRLWATDITVHAKEALADGSILELGLRVGFFGSNDLPALWAFGEVEMELQGCPILLLTLMTLRQTVNGREDVVAGDILAEMKARLAANKGCGLEDACQDVVQLIEGSVGQLVEMNGLTIRLGYKDLDLADLLDQAFLKAIALIQAFVELRAKWIPNQAGFERHFRRPIWKGKEMAGGTDNKIWASVGGISLEIADDRFESWLEFIKPLWLSELAARQVRLEQMSRQVERVTRTYATGEAETIAEAMEQQLRQLHAAYYMRNVQKRLEAFRQSRPSLLFFSIDSCRLEADLSPATIADICGLDEGSIPEDAIMDLCLKACVNLDLQGVSARLRWSTDRLASMDKMCMVGSVVIARHATWDSFSVENFVSVDREIPPCHIRRSFVPPMLYLDLAVHTENLHASYVPGFEQTLEAVGLALTKLWPPVFSLDPGAQADPLAWWDTLRRLVHGKVLVSCYATRISLISPESASISHITASSSSPQLHQQASHQRESTEQLDVQVSVVEVSYSESLIQLECWGILIEQLPNPWSLPPLVEVPSVRLRLDLEWLYPGCKEDYRIYPVIDDDRIRHCSPAFSHNVDKERFARRFRSQSVAMKVKVDVVTLIDGPLDMEAYLKAKVSVPQVGSDGSVFIQRGVQQALMCIRNAATVMIYGVSIPWASSWLTSFIGSFSRVKVQRQEGQLLSQALKKFRGHISAVHIVSVCMDGLNVLAYDSNPLDEYRHGLRVAITGQLAFSGSISEEETVPDPFETGRVKLPDIAKPFWSIHQLNLKVASLEARLCTPVTGSRGDFLFSLGVLDYAQFSKLPEDLNPSMEVITTGDTSQRSRSRLKNMLSWFSIDSPDHRRLSHSPSWGSSYDREQQHPSFVSQISSDPTISPHHRPQSPPWVETGAKKFKPSDDPMKDGQLFAHMSEAFLHSAVVDDFKLVITLESRDALLEMAESYYNLLIEAIPHLFQMPPDAELSGLSKSTVEGPESGAGRKREAVPHEGLPDPLTMSGSIVGQKVNSGGKTLWSKNRRPSLSDLTMRNLFSLEFNRTQIQLLDHENKGCVVLTLDYACMQGRVGIDEKPNDKCLPGRDGTVSEEDRQNLLLQDLAQRALEEYTESIMVSVQSLMVLMAPTDVDVGVGLVWLPDAAFRLGLAKSVEDATSSSLFTTFGLLRPVLNPLPMELDILAIHERSLHHVVRIDLPEIKCAFDTEEFLLFRKVMEHILAAPLPKLEEHASNKQTRRLRAQLSSATVSRPMDIKETYVEKQNATWEIRRLKQVLQVIRQPLTQSVSEAGQGPSYMMEETFNALREVSRRSLIVNPSSMMPTLPLPVGEQMLTFQAAVDNWIQDVEDRLVRLENDQQKLMDYFQRQVTELKRKKRTKPNTQLEWTIAGLTLQLKQMQRPFLEAALVGLTGSLSAFEDESAELGLEVSGIEVEDLRTSPPTLLIFSSSVLRRSPKAPFSPRAMALLRTSEEGPENLLRLQADLGAPVGGLTILRHFEVNCGPITARLSRGVIVQVYEFFMPPEENQDQSQANRASFLTSPAELLPGTNKTSRFRGGGGGSSSNSSSSSSNNKLRPPKPPRRGSRDVALPPAVDESGANKSLNAPNNPDYDLTVLKKRAQRNLVFKHFRFGEVNIYFSYSGAKWGNLEDVDHLHLKLHPIVYSNKTLSAKEFLLRLRKDVILDLLSQVNRNFSNLGAFLQQSVASWAYIFGDNDEDEGRGATDDLEVSTGGRGARALSGVTGSLSAPATPHVDGSASSSQAVAPPPEGRGRRPSVTLGSNESPAMEEPESEEASMEARKKLLFGGHHDSTSTAGRRSTLGSSKVPKVKQLFRFKKG